MADMTEASGRSSVALRRTAGNETSQERMGAAAKVLAVLEAFSAHGGSISLAELSIRTGLAKSTAHRMLRFLREAEFVESVGGHYYLSDKVSMLSAGRATGLTPSARVNLMPYLAELYELTHEVVQLVVRAGSSSHVIERLHSYRSNNLAAQRSDAQPLNRTAAGKVLAAGSPGSDWRWLPASHQASLDQELSVIRASGVAYERGSWHPGVSGVAAAVRDAKQEVVAAIAIIGPAGRFRPEAVASHLRRIAMAASREITVAGRVGISRNVAS